MIPLSALIPCQIELLLQSLDDSNSTAILQELNKSTTMHGEVGSILVIQTCLNYLNIYDKDLKNVKLHPLYAAIFKDILKKPNFCTVIHESLSSESLTQEFLENLSSALDLSASEKIRIGLALSDSENHDIRTCGKKFCMGQITEFCNNHTALESTDLIEHILVFLDQSEGLSKHVDSFMTIVSSVQSQEGSQFILSPFLPDEAHYENSFRQFDLLTDGGEDDLDAIIAEMEKEISMSDILSELGHGCTASVSLCKEILSSFSPISEVTVAKILGTVVRTDAVLGDDLNSLTTFCSAFGINSSLELQQPNKWNINVLVDSIKQLVPGINWINVMENLDHEGFYIANESAFSLFMSIYRSACQDPFPLHSVCGFVWKNAEGQLSFLKYAVSMRPEVFTFAHSDRQLTYDEVTSAHTNQAWSCLDLLEVLCRLSELGHASVVQSILENPLNHCPEILLLGLAHVKTTYNLIQNEVASVVLPLLQKNASSNVIILNMWHANPKMLLRGVINAMNVDPNNTSWILDVCLELKILFPVLDMIPSYFAIRIASLAFKKEVIDLENWLSNNLLNYKDAFYEECLGFVKEYQNGDQDVSSNRVYTSVTLVNSYLEACPTFIKALQSHFGIISSSHLSEEMDKLSVTYIRAHTRNKNGGGSDTMSESYSDDVEAEANSYFHQMFSGQLGIDAMLQILARFKESSEKREKSIFECIIGNLFEEYKFFSKYPERQLKIAAVLFGSVIKHKLVTHIPLGIALRAVLDALRKPTDSKMFVFGTKALEQFVDRLIEWPQYCNHILQISHLRGTHVELVAFIERALASISAAHSEPVPISNSSSELQTGPIQSSTVNVETNLPQRLNSLDERKTSVTVSNYMKPTQPTTGHHATAPSSDTTSTQKEQGAAGLQSSNSGFPQRSRGFGSALNIETLVAAAERRDTPIEAPASEVQDKISFLINNLSSQSIEAKAKEFTEVLNEQYYPWFAQYLVMKRASIEPNFHELYLKFVEKVNMKPLNRQIVQATYENCKVLLGSELIKSSVEERSLLKSLGSWLGKITIGKNHFLRGKEIDPKSLIIEAYKKGLMIAVIPFTSKILEACSNSIAYQPPNPWTMGILGLLAEIYAMPNLKMNLKFDIEVLFKNLGVDLKDVEPTSLLGNIERETDGNPDFSTKDLGSSQQTQTIVNETKPQTVLPTRNQNVEKPLDVVAPRVVSHPRIVPQYTQPPHMLADDEKLVNLGFSDQVASQSLMQGPSPFSVSQLPQPAAANIEQQVVVNKKLQAYGLHVPFQSALPIAMDRAVKEIVSSIIQRSVSIATQTSKELVLKDYAMEPDETIIHNAAHLMVARLAGSLAHVTCKEPLRVSISSQLRSLLQSSSISGDLLEQAVQLVTNDNLDLGCVLIEQAATEKAVQTIDGEIAQQLSVRRKHRESMGPAFFESSMYPQPGQIGVLPEALRPRPGQLSHSQQRVYEDFARFPGQNRSSQISNVLPSTSSSLQLIASSGLVNAGISQTLESGPEEMVMNEAQIPSAPSMHFTIGGDGPISAQNIEDDVASYSPTPIPKLQAAEASDSVKEQANVHQQLISTTTSASSNASEPLFTTGDALEKYQIISEKLENLLADDANEAEFQGVISEVPGVILRCISRDEAALAVAQKAFKGLYENTSNNDHVKAHLAILAAIRDVTKLVVKELTSWVIYSEEDRKFNKDIIIGLIHSDLLNLAEYNVHMAKLLDAGRNKSATEFAISLIQTLVTSDSKVISELHNLVDALAKLASRPGSPESLQQLVEIAKNPVTSAKEKKATGSKEDYIPAEFVDSDPVGFHEQVSVLFADWFQICEHPGTNDTAPRYVMHLQQSGLLKGDDISDRFFRRIMDLSVSHCLSSEVINSNSSQSHHGQQPLSFLAIDIYAKLVFSVLKFCPVDQGTNKLSLLPKVLAVTVKVIQKDAEEKRTSFNPRPYFRLFVNWLLDLCSLDPVSDGANFQVLTALANSFHAIQPLKVPGFSFAWLELVSHRSFMPKLLTANGQKGWPYFQRLLVDLLQFMEPFLRNAELGEPAQFLYKGTLRVLLVILHDFPEFLCDYHFSFCDVIPPSCIQMRNIILSAFPRNMRLPDPSTPNLKIDLLTEIKQPPIILSEVDAALRGKQMKNDVDEYLKTRQQGSSFLTDLKQKLHLPPPEAARSGTRYNVPLINSLVLYIGMQAIQQLQARGPAHTQSMASMMFLNIFQTLIMDLDSEGRYLFLNAIANQLRYPNNHTHHFSFILLYLFAESNQEMIQEQITRVLLERLIVNRPHPWGLLITFIELVKNPRYNFWSRSFIRCAPGIEKLFELVSRSCGGSLCGSTELVGPKPVDEGGVSGGIPDTMH